MFVVVNATRMRIAVSNKINSNINCIGKVFILTYEKGYRYGKCISSVMLHSLFRFSFVIVLAMDKSPTAFRYADTRHHGGSSSTEIVAFTITRTPNMGEGT